MACVCFARNLSSKPGGIDLKRTTELDSPPIRVRMGQQRHHRIECARRVVVGAARREHAGEPGLFEQHPGGKPRRRHLRLQITLQSDTPRTAQCPIGKVGCFDQAREFFGCTSTQREPRLDGLGPVAHPPMGLREPGEQNRLALVARHREHRSPCSAVTFSGMSSAPRSRGPAPRAPIASLAPSRAPPGTPGSHGARDCSGRTAPGRAPGRSRATAVPGNRACGRRAGPRRRGPTRVPCVRAVRLPARAPRAPAPPAPISTWRRGTAVHDRDRSGRAAPAPCVPGRHHARPARRAAP